MSGNAPHLPGFLDSLRPVLDHYGYLAVTGFVLLEDFGVPVPGETILILGAVYAGTGRLQIWLVGVLGFLGAVIGDNIGFAIGHFGGRPLVERYGRFVFLTPERLDKTTAFFERRGARIIVIARFIEGLRQANGIIAGISGMHWARFLAYNAIGAALWVAVWTCVGYFSGNHLTSIYNAFTSAGVYALIAAGLLLAAYIAWRVMRARRRRAERAAAETERETPASAESAEPEGSGTAAEDATPTEDATPAKDSAPAEDATPGTAGDATSTDDATPAAPERVEAPAKPAPEQAKAPPPQPAAPPPQPAPEQAEATPPKPQPAGDRSEEKTPPP
jgi:membrane protein DedA with SNARE-associated domain